MSLHGRVLSAPVSHLVQQSGLCCRHTNLVTTQPVHSPNNNNNNVAGREWGTLSGCLPHRFHSSTMGSAGATERHATTIFTTPIAVYHVCTAHLNVCSSHSSGWGNNTMAAHQVRLTSLGLSAHHASLSVVVGKGRGNWLGLPMPPVCRAHQ